MARRAWVPMTSRFIPLLLDCAGEKRFLGLKNHCRPLDEMRFLRGRRQVDHDGQDLKNKFRNDFRKFASIGGIEFLKSRDTN